VKLRLVDRNPKLVDCWKRSFEDCPDVWVELGDLFDCDADVIVSPANSFGVMDGGLDLYIRSTLGEQVEVRLRERILSKHHGELPVGQAEFIETGNERWPWMAAAPTMRVPSVVPVGFPAAYLALRAVLLGLPQTERIESVVCPGLGTGVGKLDPALCANQMRYAYEVSRSDPKFPSFRQIYLLHAAMTGAPTWPTD